MSIDGGVPCSAANQMVFARGRAPATLLTQREPLRYAKVDYEYLMNMVTNPCTEVGRLDIAMDDFSAMQILDGSDHFIHHHQNRLQRKPPLGLFEQLLQRWAQ